MSKSIQSSPTEYPLSFAPAYNQMPSNPFQQNLLTPTSILPTNIQVRTRTPVQRATQVAQGSLWILPPELTPGSPINPAFKQVTKCANETQQNQSDSILNDEDHSREARQWSEIDLAKAQADCHPLEYRVNNLPVLPQPTATKIPPLISLPVPQHPSVSYTQTAIFKEIPNPTKKGNLTL